MKEVTVLFFATLRDRAGIRETKVTLSDESLVSDLKEYLGNKFPDIKPNLQSALVSVNREFAFDQDPIPEGAEIAIFPPVSGGNRSFPTVLLVTEEEINIDSLLDQITLPTTGAACFFSGMVRGITRQNKQFSTESLEYEAYRPMAVSKMQQLAEEIRSRWPEVEGIAIVQRIGHLLVGTPTVIIACSAAHRNSGVFEAARFGIDRLKEIVPIWKKEIGSRGESWIEGEYLPKRTDQSG